MRWGWPAGVDDRALDDCSALFAAERLKGESQAGIRTSVLSARVYALGPKESNQVLTGFTANKTQGASSCVSGRIETAFLSQFEVQEDGY